MSKRNQVANEFSSENSRKMIVSVTEDINKNEDMENMPSQLVKAVVWNHKQTKNSSTDVGIKR